MMDDHTDEPLELPEEVDIDELDTEDDLDDELGGDAFASDTLDHEEGV